MKGDISKACELRGKFVLPKSWRSFDEDVRVYLMAAWKEQVKWEEEEEKKKKRRPDWTWLRLWGKKWKRQFCRHAGDFRMHGLQFGAS